MPILRSDMTPTRHQQISPTRDDEVLLARAKHSRRQVLRLVFDFIRARFPESEFLRTHPLVRIGYRVFARNLRTPGAYVVIDGLRIHLDPNDSLGVGVTGAYDPFELEIYRAILREGDSVIDVGANIGYFTTQFARLVGPRGRVFAFEPEPSNFALLQENLRLNALHNVVAENAAVSDTNGTAKLYLAPGDSTDHRLVAPNDWTPVRVKVVSLDDYFGQDTAGVRLVKMDIQGSEGKAIRGMARVLRSTPSIVLVTEFCPHLLSLSGTDPILFLSFIRELGFEILNLNERSKSIESASISELLEKYGSKRDYYTNLLCATPDTLRRVSRIPESLLMAPPTSIVPSPLPSEDMSDALGTGA
jgi:FkbM family methyltransferase